VLDLIAQDGLADVFGHALSGELGRVHADDHELFRVLGFELLQVGDHVDAVDAAVSPEVEQHHLAPQVAQAERAVRVEPFDIRREIRGVNLRAVFGHRELFLRYGRPDARRAEAGGEQ
jgi:hypothetical protein